MIFLLHRVTQYERRNLGRAFAAIIPGESLVIGYYTLAASSVAISIVPLGYSHKLPRHPLPVALIARLAVDSTHQGRRIGEGLLMDALQRIIGLSDQLGLYAVE